MTEKLTHKQRTRARILDEAAKAMREHGFEGIGVASLMKRAGLTHGGFYAHFESRDDLVAHTVERMFQDNRTTLARHLDQGDLAAGLVTFINDYLSEGRLALTGRGCPLPPLLGEAARMPSGAREGFTKGLEGFRNRLRDALVALGHANAQDEAFSALAEMVGAVAAARALGEGETASAFLRASRIQIKRRLGLDPQETDREEADRVPD